MHASCRLPTALTAALIASAASAWLPLAAAPTPPNVIVILPDQWRAQAFGFAGDRNVHTPNLDRLAGQSVNLVNAVAGTPVCSPTRASIMTGQRALTNGVFLNDVALTPTVDSLGRVLATAGFDTGYIGKWHLNGGNRLLFIPPCRRQGFDYWKACECTHDYNQSVYLANTPQPLQWKGYDAIAQTDDAVHYVRTHAHTGKPFLLFLAWGPPHSPYETAPEKYRAMYDRDKIVLRANVPAGTAGTARAMLANYYAHCTALDDCLGTLRAALADAGLEENTLLIFTSDHGDLLGSQGGFNKQQPYDESVRVPLLVHWPAALGTAAKTLDAPINSEDIMPTILGLCGVRIPASVEGRDYSTYLRGGASPSDGATLISCAAPFGQWTRKVGGREYRGVRTERYTYVRDLKGPWLLFDNLRDPYQEKNLVGQPNTVILQAGLEARLAQKLAAAHDLFLPAEAYIKQWGYAVDKDGTMPY